VRRDDVVGMVVDVARKDSEGKSNHQGRCIVADKNEWICRTDHVLQTSKCLA
jgi:hypothetical protein